MATEALTDDQRNLLLRWFDGELDTRKEVDRAEQLVETSDRARTFVETLEQLQSSAVAAFEAARPAADELPAPEQVVERAADADPLDELPFGELAPLLERFHDGEITDPARAAVERLVDRRDDAAAYLEQLEALGDATRAARDAALEEAELDGLRADIQRDIAFADHPDDPPAYEPSRDEPLLHRFVDGELPESKRDLVETWLEDNPEATRTVETLEELGGAAEAAHQQATEQVDFESLRAGIDDRISELSSETDAEHDNESADVVSLDSSRTDGGRTGESRTDETRDDSGDTRTTGWFSGYRQGLVGAAAAALLVAAAGVLFGTNLLENERVVVKEKTVVIVDSVQYDKGSSVVVDSPMKKVSANNQTGSSGSEGSSSDSGDEQPTVIWLLDSDKQQSSDDAAEESSPSETPNDSENSRDAGSPDGDSSSDDGEHRGQPI